MTNYVDFSGSVLVDAEGSIIYRTENTEDDGYKEGSSSDNYECMIDDEEEEQVSLPALSDDFDTSNLARVTLSDGTQALVNINDLNMTQENAVEMADGSTLMIEHYHNPPVVDRQQIQLEDGRVAILHATTEQTEGYQPVQMEDGNVAFIALSDLMGKPLDPSTFIICEEAVKTEIELDDSILIEETDPMSEDPTSAYPPLSPQTNVEEDQSEVEDETEQSIEYSMIQDGKLFGGSMGERAIIRIDRNPALQDSSKPVPSLEGYTTVEFSDATFYLPISGSNDNDPNLGSILAASKKMLTEIPEENNELSMRDRTKSIVCPEQGCGKTYTTLHHLKVHQRAHTGDRPFHCTIEGCNKAFSTGYGRKAHVRTHTGEKPYKCPDGTCTKSFKTSGDLQKHVRTHTGERPFRCHVPECGRSFTTSNIRKVHYRTHTGERPYVCSHQGCGRAFASATNFKNHTRIHSGEKPYQCSVEGCGKRFTEYSSLYKHHMVHTQQKPYNCSNCERNYRQASTLTMHKRTAHGIVEAPDGTELILGETVFAFSEEAVSGGKRLKALGSNFLGYNKKGNKGVTNIQVTETNQDSSGQQQFLVLANSAQIAALEQLGASHPTSLLAVGESDEEDDEDVGICVDDDDECVDILSGKYLISAAH